MRHAAHALLPAALLLTVSAPVWATGDLTGIWVVETPVHTLKTSAGAQPPLTDAALAAYKQRRTAATKGDFSWDPVRNCKPPGEPRTLLEMSWPFEVMQSPHRIDFLFQWNRLDREIPLIDRQPAEYQGPYYFGQSAGHWDGDTLVVDVIGEKDNTFLDPSGLPHSVDMTMQERFRAIDAGKRLELTVHITDPANYRMPWDARVTFRRAAPGTHIQEDVCIERLHLHDYATLDNAVKTK